VRLLEDDLRHVERSLRRGAARLRAEAPRCQSCGFTFRDRAPARYAAPSRCPLCRSERIHPGRLRIG
jgi:predicted Zn-ribbon and HTH transcriptional regulator